MFYFQSFRGIILLATLSRQVQWGNATADSREGSALIFSGLKQPLRRFTCTHTPRRAELCPLRNFCNAIKQLGDSAKEFCN